MPRYDRSDDPPYSGGFADVWMGEHEGTAVAVKVPKVTWSSNLDEIRNVGRRPAPFRQCEWRCLFQLLRDFAGKSSCGEASAIQTCSHC